MRIFLLLILFFSLNLIYAQNTHGSPCDVNIDCQSATIIDIPIQGGMACIEGCNFEMPGSPFCTGTITPTAWFKFNSGNNNKVTIRLEGEEGLTNPTFSISRNCSSLIRCDSQEVLIAPNTEYTIAVSDRDGGQGNFSLCITLEIQKAPCVKDEIFEVIATSLASPLEGPYKPGEVLTFSYSTNFFSGGGCQWLHSFIPTLGSCWGNTLPQILSYPEGLNQAVFKWATKGSITWKPTENFPASPLGIGQDGNLCNIGTLGCTEFIGGGECGINGTPMPAGWVVSTPSGNCMGSSEPNVSWGVPQGCSSNKLMSFTFNLIIPEDLTGCKFDGDLKVGMTAFSDGATGGWNNPECNGNGIIYIDVNVATLSKPDHILESYKVNPNPNNGQFIIELPSILEGTVEIYDLNGRRVYVQELDPGITLQQITVDNLHPSVYNLIVRRSDGLISGNTRIAIIKN